MRVETNKGWTEAIIDRDCEFDEYYRIADILTNHFHLQFTGELHDFDTIYKDFDFNGSALCLHYNIYLGASIYPKSGKESTMLDNRNVLEIGQLLFNKMIDLDWDSFENGNTVGKKGTEGGTIIVDLENLNGARITLEKDCGHVPFAITLGIYGLIMHTHFESNFVEANEYVTQSKFKINKILYLYNVKDKQNAKYWKEKYNKKINELAEITRLEPNAPEKTTSPNKKMKPQISWWRNVLRVK